MEVVQVHQFEAADLELVVKEKHLGTLVTNAVQIRENVRAALPRYDAANYGESNIDQAKADKAMLNKASKTLNDARIELEKEFLKPFGEFKDIVAETVGLIKECSGKIDNVVKEVDQRYKDEKRAAIQQYFDERNENLIDFRKIFDEKWLNKTASMKSVQREIDATLQRIENDLNSLDAFGEDAPALRAYYSETLNLSATVNHGNQLKEQRRRAAEAEDARERAEAERRQAEEAARAAREEAERLRAAARQQEIPYAAATMPTATAAEPTRPRDLDFMSDDPAPYNPATAAETAAPAQSAAPEMLVRAFRVCTTRENIIALGDFMNERGIEFCKIDV